jgi:hypothetical protein
MLNHMEKDYFILNVELAKENPNSQKLSLSQC